MQRIKRKPGLTTNNTKITYDFGKLLQEMLSDGLSKDDFWRMHARLHDDLTSSEKKKGEWAVKKIDKWRK